MLALRKTDAEQSAHKRQAFGSPVAGNETRRVSGWEVVVAGSKRVVPQQAWTHTAVQLVFGRIDRLEGSGLRAGERQELQQ